ncbi:MAG: hypothetical protein WAM66_08650 [Acidobacteriaceae bacterium]
MIMKISSSIALLGIVLLVAVGVGHSTRRVVQKEISVSRALAGHVYVRGTNAPATRVKVDLCNSDWKTVIASTTTDKKGYFSLKKPTTGELFYIRMSAPGMDIYQFRVRINQQAAQELVVFISVAT